MEEVLDNPSTGVAPAVEKYLIARGKAHVIRRDPPSTTDPTFDQWEQEDALVCTLLWQSMAPHVSRPLMLLPTAKRIWDQVTLLYSAVANISRICSTYSEWVCVRCGDLPLATHYSHFVGLCQQLDVYMPLTTDLTEAARQRDQIRVVQYLESLGPKYMHLRQQIIGSGDISSLTEIYSRVQQCSPGDPVISVPIDGSALTTYDGSTRPPCGGASSAYGRGGGRSSGGCGRSFCTHCQREGHYIDHCYTLHPELR
ncbi:uncharacterized protein LOC143861494 [Tasmannia lanceolata]|uniref:uncharacterized protein LOC143861494 n=1 Tax=Tasmannia lanceolata TaxID=3420 RepID=UPI004064AA74